MAGHVVSPELIGREAEAAALARGVDDAQRGVARTILIGGDAGIGKTRLLTEALEHARPRARVLSGGCIPIAEGSLPFAPLVAAIRPLLLERDASLARGGLEGVAAELASIREGSARLPAPDARPGWARAHLYERFLELFRSLTRERPVVLAIEDLHWADTSTLELLSFLARAGRGDRLLLALTFRSEALERRDPLLTWLSEMERLPGSERIELAPLRHDETGRQIAAILRRTPDASFVDRVHRRAEGNPFFVEELVSAGTGGALPPTLRDVLAARLARVSDTTLDVLGIAAVIGREVDHSLLAAVAGRDERELDVAIREAITTGLLVVRSQDLVEGYAFRHALLAEAAAATVTPTRQRQLHVAIAEALTTLLPRRASDEPARLGEIAHHWFAGGDLTRALPASLAAAQAATATGGYEEAYRQYRRAVELWETVEEPERVARLDRIELLRRAAAAAQLAGAFVATVAFLREAIERARATRTDPTAEGLLYERLGRALYESGEMQASLDAYQHALELVPEQPPNISRVRVVAGYAQMLSILSRTSESVAVAERALLVAREARARQLEGTLLTTIGIGLAEGERAGDGIALLQEALAIAREVDHVDDLFRAYANLVAALGITGRNSEAIEAGLEGLAAASDRAMTSTWGAILTTELAAPLTTVGRWDEAIRLLRDVPTDSAGVVWIGPNKALATLLTLRGEDSEAADLLDELEKRLGPGADPQWLEPVATSRIELAIRHGDVAAGRRAVDRVLPVLASIDDTIFHVRVLVAALRLEAFAAELARASRDEPGLDEAVRRAELQLMAFRSRLDEPRSWTRRAIAQALLLGEAEMSRVVGEANPSRWRAVLSAVDSTTAVHELAYARFRLAEALIAGGSGRGMRDEAHAILAQAYEATAMLGARPLCRQIEALAARSRLRLERRLHQRIPDLTQGGTGSVAVGADNAFASWGLTTREVEVLGLLATGSTNREIGEALFITESTAGVHVSHILRKLDVHRRVEAATIAARLKDADVATSPR